MFETVAPDAFVRRSRLVFYESLPVSIAVHALAVIAVGGLTWSVISFPDQPPRVTSRYFISSLDEPPPPPPPPPAASAAARAPENPAQQVQPVPGQEVEPTIIPDAIPVVPVMASEAKLVLTPAASNEGAGSGVVGGVDGGEVGGVIGGALGGTIGGIPGGHLGEDGRLHFDRDVPLPMLLERQDLPDYPERARRLGWEDTVVIHYIIGKDGKVYDVKVAKKSYRQDFEEPALEAIKHWRFRPLIANGAPIEVVHELTVYFRLN